MAKKVFRDLEKYDPDVLERLPYWVREILRMIGEIEASSLKKKMDVHGKTPTQE